MNLFLRLAIVPPFSRFFSFCFQQIYTPFFEKSESYFRIVRPNFGLAPFILSIFV